MIISDTFTTVEQDAGAISSDPTLNNVCAVGAGLVTTACVGGVILNVVTGIPLGAVYYAGLATLGGAGTCTCVKLTDISSNGKFLFVLFEYFIFFSWRSRLYWQPRICPWSTCQIHAQVERETRELTVLSNVLDAVIRLHKQPTWNYLAVISP